MRKKLYKLALLALAFAALTGCTSNASTDNDASSGVTQKAITVRLGTPNAIGIMGGVAGLADLNGYLAEELDALGYGYEIVGFAGAGPAVNEALIAKEIDFAVLADFPAITAKAKGVDTTLIAVENSLSNCALAVSPDSEYDSIEDLVGKKIAIPKGTYMQRFFVLLIEEKGLLESDFEIIQMTNDMESALVSGSVDAILFTSDTINKIESINGTGRIIASTTDYPDYSGQSFFVGRSAVIEETPEIAEAILRAFIRARAFALENPAEAAEILAEAGHSSPEVIEATYGFSSPNAQTQYAFALTEESLAKLEQTKSFLLEYAFISENFDAQAWYQSNIYETVNAS